MKTKEQQAEEYAVKSPSSEYCSRRDFLAGYDAAVKDMGWRKVEDELPQEGQLIVEAYTLVAKADGYTQSTEHFLMAKYKGKFVCDGKEEHYFIGSSKSTTHHWMPIPEGGDV